MVKWQDSPNCVALLDDLKLLAAKFEKLFERDCECVITSDRHYWPSRFPDGGIRFSPPRHDSHRPVDHFRGGQGLQVAPTPASSPEDFGKAQTFYGRNGAPFVNSAGQPWILEPGWKSVHSMTLRGEGSLRAKETIEFANSCINSSGAGIIAAILWPGKSLVFRNFCWPDVVDRVAELTRSAAIRPSQWFVEAGGQSYSMDVWERRADFRLSGDIVAKAIVDEIGDKPEHVWAKRESFIGDSEAAAWLLIEQVEELAKSEPGKESYRKALVDKRNAEDSPRVAAAAVETLEDPQQSIDSKLYEAFQTLTSKFEDSCWTKMDRRTARKAKEGRGRSIAPVYFDEDWGVYFGDDRNWVFKKVDDRRGWVALDESNSDDIALRIAGLRESMTPHDTSHV